MSDIAIRVEKLGKLYRVGQFVGYRTLRESLVNAFSAPFRYLRSSAGLRSEPQDSDSEYIWALKDVSFEVKHGEAVGIIGLNGAGKTTLLKVLCRITEPTEGYAEIYGRVGSLLEVGTGFHPELTGRENIYLNGAVLGMKKKEIDRKFDEIVEFAEVEKFIDTPLKRYSTGMQVRLAFSVAAHMEPEILLVDEVLAVGDIGFQKKCLGKMHDVTHRGRTVLFVSHNMLSIMNLCNRAILLTRGKVEMNGSASDVIKHYISAGQDTTVREVKWDDPKTALGDEDIRLHSVSVLSPDGKVDDILTIEDDIIIKITYWNFVDGASYLLNIILTDQDGAKVLSTVNAHSASIGKDPWFNRPHPVGLYESACRIPGGLLNDHMYSMYICIARHGVVTTEAAIKEEDILSFTIHDTGAMSREYRFGFAGSVRPKLYWRTELKGRM